MPLPDRLRAHAEAMGGEVAVPRDASTIVLLRDGSDGAETYLMRRQTTMAFAAGFYVFPGGGVQSSDTDPIAHVGPSWQEWGDRLGCDADRARGLVVAAVRETFEESGILLAGADEHTVLADTSGPELAAARLALESKELSLAQLLEQRGLVLRTDLVGAWSRWITPAFEPRRYDTFFFVAAVPEGQVVGELPGEADRALWAPLSRVLESVDRGEAVMMPPTIVTCREVAGLASGEAVAASVAREVRAIEPRLVQVDGEWFIENDSDRSPEEEA
ncbi:hypothetical protein ASD11_13945 [Aeromicrobium sp. Root495]|nr:hypothetical protein ASD11_13945 [Aeromicrobium sp. Root495]